MRGFQAPTTLPIRLLALLMALAALPCATAQSLPIPQAEQTRKASFTYDETTGLLKEEWVEPDNPELCVKTTHEYDPYGNRSKSTTAPCPGASSSATFSERYATTDLSAPAQLTPGVLPGSYPLQTANQLGHTERKKFNPAFGQPEELLGPNGLKTTWSYDEFGRKVKETRADGSYTEVLYCYANGPNGPPYNPLAGSGGNDAAALRTLACSVATLDVTIPGIGGATPSGYATLVHTQAYYSDGTVAGPWSRVYHDRLGREIRSLTQAFDAGDQATKGWFIAADTRYNANGAKILTTQPYFIDNTGAARGSLPGSTAGAAYGLSFIHHDVLGRAVFAMSSEGDSTPGARSVGELAALTGPAAGAMKVFQALGLPAALLNQRFSYTVTAYDGPKAMAQRPQPAVTAGGGIERLLTDTSWRNPQGKVILTQDAAGAQTGYGYDAQDNLVTTLDPLGNRTEVRYDARGRRTHLSDPNKGLWTYEYNALGELVAQQSPNQRAKGRKTSFSYDPLGRLVRRLSDEYLTEYLYDTQTGQAGIIDQTAGSACLSTATTTGNSSATSTVGRLCGTRTSHGVVRATTYDSKLRVLSETTQVGVTGGTSRSFTQSTTYDTQGRPYRATYPSGLQVETQFSTLGFVTSVGQVGAGYTYYQAWSVNAWGKVEDGKLGHGVWSRNRFDPLSGRATRSAAGTGPSATDTSVQALNVASHQYHWDSLGNLQMRGDEHGDGQGVATGETFLYDPLNRLLQYKVNGHGVSRTVDLQYNALGNILSKSDVGSYVYPQPGQPQPHAVQFIRSNTWNTGYNADFRYDAQGNLTSATGSPKYRTLRYNSFNLPQGGGAGAALEGATDAQGRRSTYDWAYDEDQQRIREIRSNSRGTRTTWYLHPDGAGGLNYELEQDESGTLNHRHFIAAGSATAMVLTTGAQPTTVAKVEYWHKDHLGSTVAVTVATSNGTGLARIIRYAYDPFGKRRYESGAYDASGALIADYSGGDPYADAGTDRGFTGHEHLDDVGVIHMNGRTYDPLIARFMQGDPVVGDPYDLQTYNGYSYVYNRPLNAVDADGRCPWCAWAVVALVTARATGIINQQTFRQMLGIVVAAWLGPGGYTMLADTAANAALNTAIAGFASGVVSSGNLKGGMQGMFTSMVFYGAGVAADGMGAGFGEGSFGRAVFHAGAGCITSVAGGGKCGQGAVSAGAANFLGSKLANGNDLHDTIIHGVIGGTASVLGGGKFANGAVTGAFGYLYNSRFHKFMVGIQAHATWTAYIQARYGDEGYVANRASAALDFDTINFNGRPDTIAPGETSSKIWELKSQRCLADSACRLSAEIQLRGYQTSASLKSDGSPHLVMLGDAAGVGLANGPITRTSGNGVWEFEFKFDGDGLVGYKGTRNKQNGGGGGTPVPAPIPVPPPCDCKDKDRKFGPLSPAY